MLFDVNAGLVTAEGARRYGVVVKGTTGAAELDAEATNALRAELAEGSGELSLFDFGGSIDELKSRCDDETGLPAPKTPVFQKWATIAQTRAKSS